jgi:hypothetical protein
MPGSIGFRDQQKAIVPMDTTGPGGRRLRTTTLPLFSKERYRRRNSTTNIL